MDTTTHAMHHPAPYPPTLKWRHVMTRLFIVNELLVLVGALSMHATERLDPKLTQVMGLPYYLLWMHCIGLCALFLNGTVMLILARRGWRAMPDAQARHARLGLYKGLPGTVKWRMVGTSLLTVCASAWLSRQLFIGLLGSPLGASLPQAYPPFEVGLFNTLYGTIVVYVFEYFQDRHALSQAREETARKLSAQAQLDLLRSQLDPHMLFNTLSNLYVLIDDNPAQARSMLTHLIDFLRSTLAGSRATQHGLGEEFRLTADYLWLMQFRMGDRLRPQLTLPDELRDTPVPAMLLQPLVENAIKHGLEARKDGGMLSVSAMAQGQQLVLRVCNSGIPAEHAANASPDAPTPSSNALSPLNPSGSGFGLSFVRDRLAALYGEAASVDLLHLSSSNTTEVTLRLPLNATAS